jgi:hypothetical protein
MVPTDRNDRMGSAVSRSTQLPLPFGGARQAQDFLIFASSPTPVALGLNFFLKEAGRSWEIYRAVV